MSAMSAFRRWLVAPGAGLLLPAYLSACFRYAPASVEPLPGQRSEVRVHLTDPLRVPMGEVTLEEVTSIEGIVAEATDDTLNLWAKWLYPRAGRKYDAMGTTFQVSKGSIARLDRYRFSPQLTAGAVLVTGVVLVGFLYAIGVAKFGGTAGDIPPENQSVRGWGVR